MSDSPATFSYAAPPFDHPQADVILHSSDNIDFRVFKLFLSLASPVFEILEVDSLACFAVARRADLREQCVLAAKYSLREPLIPPWFEGIQFISSTDLLALLTYHKNCANAVLALQSNLGWIQNHYRQSNSITWMASGCGSCNRPRSSKFSLLGSQLA